MTDVKVHGKRSRVSAIWLVPLVSLALGAGVVAKSFLDQGPLVEVHFATAEGLEAGKTSVKRLSVDVGIVEEVRLDGDAEDVVAMLRFDPSARRYLRKDTQFWVVRPRIGAGGVSGLSTLLSGGYVEIAPGNGPQGARRFTGLEEPPRVSMQADGVRLQLISSRAASLGAGSPVHYRGFRVGEVESVELDFEEDQTRYHLFIEAPYDDLVFTGTRFWNVSGVKVAAGADGVSIHTESIESLLAGGVSFEVPPGTEAGTVVADHHEFRLFDSVEATRERTYEHVLEYLLLFDSSVRGLSVGAPVEYRGMRTGSVVEISFDLVPQELGWSPEGHALIPVLIRLEPGRFGPDEPAEVERLRKILTEATQHGLRAQLSTSSLLTGALFVDFEYFPHALPSDVRQIGERSVYPTIEANFARLQEQIEAILTKFESLPLESVLGSADRAIETVTGAATNADEAVTELRQILSADELRALPANLDKAIVDLDEVLGGFKPEGEAYRGLVETLDGARSAIDGFAPESEAYRNLIATLNAAQTSVDGLAPGSVAYGQLIAAIDAIRVAVQDASHLIEVLGERPSALLFSSRRGADSIPGRSK